MLSRFSFLLLYIIPSCLFLSLYFCPLTFFFLLFFPFLSAPFNVSPSLAPTFLTSLTRPHPFTPCCVSAVGAVWHWRPPGARFPENHPAPRLWKILGSSRVHPQTNQQHFLTVKPHTGKPRAQQLHYQNILIKKQMLHLLLKQNELIWVSFWTNTQCHNQLIWCQILFYRFQHKLPKAF